MSRSIRTYASLALVFTTAALAMACDKSGTDAQAEVNAAQNKANSDISKANSQVTTTAATAQAEADKKITAAQADFATTREDYRHDVQTKLDALNKQLADLDIKARGDATNGKPDLRATLPALRSQRDAFVTDYQSLGSVSAVTWDATKVRLDKEWADLKAAADKAS